VRRLPLCTILLSLILLAGCATQTSVGRAKYPSDDFARQDGPRPLAVSDPIEPLNRSVYRFNFYFDRFVFLPVVDAYRFVLPNYVQARVSNFFDNIGDLTNLMNATFQLKPNSAATSLSRFVVNSTIGILGLWDPASGLGLQRQDEDFGQTLGHYGVAEGAYLILPALGPSNLRDTTGLVVDGAAFSAVDPLNFDKNNLKVPYYALQAIDARRRQPFRYYRSGSPFEYEFVRLLYTEQRKLRIAK